MDDPIDRLPQPHSHLLGVPLNESADSSFGLLDFLVIRFSTSRHLLRFVVLYTPTQPLRLLITTFDSLYISGRQNAGALQHPFYHLHQRTFHHGARNTLLHIFTEFEWRQTLVSRQPGMGD